MADLNKYVQTNTFYLAGSGTIIGATSIVLTSLQDIYGNVLTMTDFGTTGYTTLEPDTTNEESATFTGIVANANGTYTLTGVSTTLAKAPYTQTSGLVRQHSGGTKVVVTDNVAFWNTFANKGNDETITGEWQTTFVPLNANDIANKAYVDGVAIAGAPDASTTVKGIGRVSVAPVSPTIPIFIGDNDPRVPTQGENDALVGTVGTPSSTNKYVTNDDTATAATANLLARRLAGGNITIVTESPSNNSTNAASTAYVDGATLIFKNGTTTKNTADASTTQTIAHGLGRIPKYVRVKGSGVTTSNALVSCHAEAIYNGTTQSSQSVWASDTNILTADNSFKFGITINAGVNLYQSGVVTADITNIYIAWTKNGSPTGTYQVLWEVEG